MALETGSRLGHYEVTALIGEGGMGQVYQATDTKLNRQVALKILPEVFARDSDRLARFQREAQVLASLNHPHIGQIYGLEDAGDTSALVLELVEGPTLGERMNDGPVPVDDIVPIATQITEALEAAHEANIVHRDLKPANVKITPRGQVKVLDFGIAKWGQGSDDAANAATATLTQAGVVIGTVQYMSPEQLQGGPVDGRSDLFSLGVMLYQAVAGQHPFPADSQAARVSAILRDTPLNPSELAPDCPPALDQILARCLRKEPTERFANATALQQALRDLSGDPGGQEVRPQTGGPMYRSPLIGRDAEVTELEMALGRAKAGLGSLVTLAGEPGVGKTRLSSELVQRARAEGVLSLVGHCYEGEGTVPFSPWVEILETTARIAPKDTFRDLLGDAAPEIAKLLPTLRRLFPDIPPPLELDPESERHHLFLSFTEFVERSSRVQPLLLVLEDLHWADNATLRLLQFLAPRLREMPVMAVATYRDVELDVARPLATALRQLTKDRLATRLVLRRLPESDVQVMLAALSGREPLPALVKAIHHETEGNPFFVEEVYEHLAEEGRLFDAAGNWRTDLNTDELDVPEGVRLVVGRRVERLSEPGRRALTVAAVVGRRFSYPLLEQAVDLDEDVLLDGIEGAEQLRLVEPDPDASARDPQYRFTHELIRQTLLGGLSMPRRQRLHLRVAEALERVHGPELDRHATALAHHLYEAGAAADEEKTIRFLTLAGDRAMGSSGFEEAFRNFDLALSLDPSAHEIRARLLFKRGTARKSLDQWDGALADWNEALPLQESVSDHGAVATTCRELADAYIWQNLSAHGEASARRGLAVLGPTPSADRCRLLACRAWGLSHLIRLDEADAVITEALAMAESFDDPQLEGYVRHIRFYVLLHSLRSGEGLRNAERQVACMREGRDPAGLVTAFICLHYMSVRCGRLDGLEALEQEIAGLLSRLGRLDLELVAVFTRQRPWLLSGAPADYDAYAREWDRLSTKMGAWGNVRGAWTAQAHAWKGQWHEARRYAASGVEVEPADDVQTGHAWATLFLCDCYLGRVPSALDMLDTHQRELPRCEQLNGVGAWHALFRVVEGLAVIGAHERAAEFYPVMREAIATETLVAWDAVHLVDTIAGIAACSRRAWSLAQQHFETALRQAEDIPFRSEQAEGRRWYAQMLATRDTPGDRDKARTLLGEAATLYRTFGMSKHLETVERMSADL